MSRDLRKDITTHDCLECCGRGFYHKQLTTSTDAVPKFERLMCRNCDGVGLVYISSEPPKKPKGK